MNGISGDAAVRKADDSWDSTKPAPEIAASAVEALAEVFAAAAVEGFLYAADLDDEAHLSYRGDELVCLASVFKVAVLVELFRRADAGDIELTGRLRVSQAGRTIGPTGLSMLRDEVEISLRDLAQMMISVSDNAATDVLIERLGVERINSTLRHLGLEETLLTGDCNRLLSELKQDLGLGDADPFPTYAEVSQERWAACRSLRPETTTRGTARETALLLRSIWSDQAASPNACLEMRRLLYSQIWPHRLRSGFGDEFRVGAKTGSLPGIRNEAGVVELPGGGRFAVAVFTRSAHPLLVDPAADAAIGTAARLAVEYLRRP